MSKSKNIEQIQHNDSGLHGQYKTWFLDYASYVILERAVPAIEDGLKPVQRRILHSMWELEDGRYNKVANLIGNTSQGFFMTSGLDRCCLMGSFFLGFLCFFIFFFFLSKNVSNSIMKKNLSMQGLLFCQVPKSTLPIFPNR